MFAPKTHQHRKRVLLQVDDFDEGGLEAHVCHLSEGLLRRGWAVHLLICGRESSGAANRVRRFARVHRLGRRFRELRYALLLRLLGTQLVSAHHSTFGATVAQRRGVAFVQTLHNVYVWLTPRERAEYGAADAFTTDYIAFSTVVREYSIRSMGLDREKMRLVRPGIDLAALRVPDPDSRKGGLRRALGLTSADFVFLNVATLCRPKAQLEIIEAASQLREKGVRCRVLLAGAVRDDAYHRRLLASISAHQLENTVTLLGFRDDVGELYAAADAFLFPSYFEGAGLALLEALAFGLPVIATPVGVAPEALAGHGRHRLIQAPYESIFDIHAGNLAAMLDHGETALPPVIAQAMEEVMTGPRAPQEPKCYDIESTLDEYEVVFSEALARGSRP